MPRCRPRLAGGGGRVELFFSDWCPCDLNLDKRQKMDGHNNIIQRNLSYKHFHDSFLYLEGMPIFSTHYGVTTLTDVPVFERQWEKVRYRKAC